MNKNDEWLYNIILKIKLTESFGESNVHSLKNAIKQQVESIEKLG